MFKSIIGLEIHIQLRTNSKMFCPCAASWFGKEPNTLCCPVCLGLPGSLPVPNRRAIKWCLLTGLVFDCAIPSFSKFDRKNYFYPDLPKGYQISQYDKPFAVNGLLAISDKEDKKKFIRIRRVHLEEDTGKLIHAVVDKKRCTLVDFNRSGVPLVEIVTEPEIENSNQARNFLKKLRQIVRYLGVSDADMEKGSLRIEPNVSVLKSRDNIRFPIPQSKLPKYKVEIKNINSFKFAKMAIDFEIERQIKLLKKGIIPKQETRGWDEKKAETVPQRGKEEAHDYRYFPEPDIPPISWHDKDIAKLRDRLPELPEEKSLRFVKEYKLSPFFSKVLTASRHTADYFEESVKIARKRKETAKVSPQIIADFIVNKKVNIKNQKPEDVVSKVARSVKKPTISLLQMEKAADDVVKENKKAVDDYKKGKDQAIMFLVGQVMSRLQGKADASKIKEILKGKLKGK